jgi:hypothetical protein
VHQTQQPQQEQSRGSNTCLQINQFIKGFFKKTLNTCNKINAFEIFFFFCGFERTCKLACDGLGVNCLECKVWVIACETQFHQHCEHIRPAVAVVLDCIQHTTRLTRYNRITEMKQSAKMQTNPIWKSAMSKQTNKQKIF